jgi:DNA-directed RNA polymerase specialized sigma24 family protein
MDIKVINKKSQYLLRNIKKEDAEDIKQDVFLELLEKHPVINHDSYYGAMVKNEMFEFINKERNLKKREYEYAQLMDITISKDLQSPFNNLLYKELKFAIKDQFIANNRSASRQTELLEYLMKDGNEEQSAHDIKKDLRFNTYDTAKANIRHVRLKLDEVKKLLKNDDK